nr:hypothetical protein [Tanacetum cinerariifolium]
SATTGLASDGTVKKKGRTVTLTTDDMKKRKNDVKARTTLLLSLPEIEQDDLNQKFLASLAPEWLMHTIVWRNKSDLDTMSLDDLYNHLKKNNSQSKSSSLSIFTPRNGSTKPTLARIPILDIGKFKQWKFRIQQYLQCEHYALWEVIEFGDSYEAPGDVATTGSATTGLASDGTVKKKGRTVTLTTDDMKKRKNDVKARTTLLLSLP